MVLFSSCREDFYYSSSKEFKDYSWHADSLVRFNFNISDTSKRFVWFINVRHTSVFPYQNFYVFPKRIGPNGKTYTDTLNIPLANPSGRWYGKGSGDIYDNRILWLNNMKFPEKGDYVFQFEQGSRLEELNELVSFGFSMYEYQ